MLEGSVRRDGARIHLNAQLIDTRTDTHVWAEQYDRDRSQMFAIQSEIAQKVAEQLQTKISAREKLALQVKPTADLTAFDLYSRAKNLVLRSVNSLTEKADLLQAVDLLNQAVARDPLFFDAYCQLAFIHDWLYWNSLDHTPARVALAEAAVQSATILRRDAGETHLARAQNFYWGHFDYNSALAELDVARQTLPNDARVFNLTGAIQRRQGRWEDSTRNFERSAELNPAQHGNKDGNCNQLHVLAQVCRPKVCARQHISRFSERFGLGVLARVRGITGKRPYSPVASNDRFNASYKSHSNVR